MKVFSSAVCDGENDVDCVGLGPVPVASESMFSKLDDKCGVIDTDGFRRPIMDEVVGAVMIG
jgi:hypothetical protein